MYFKSRRSRQVSEPEYFALNKNDKFLFPRSCKYFAWMIIICISLTSSVVLIYYGLYFGTIKTYLWLTGIIWSVALGVIIVTPIRIGTMALIDALFFKFKSVIYRRKMYSVVLRNPYNFEKWKAVQQLRKYNKTIYEPIPLYKLRTRMEDIKYNIELRNVTGEILMYVSFMILLISMTLFYKVNSDYENTEVVKNLVISANYTKTIPLHDVTSYDTFIEYLNDTLIPALMMNYDEYRRIHSRSVSSPSADDTKENFVKRQVNPPERNELDIFQRGWTMDPAVKLIGVPRLRQLRVSTDNCFEFYLLRGRNKECAPELSLWNKETRDFYLGWSLVNDGEELTPEQAKPWLYQSGWKSGTLPLYAKFKYYPAGGYILHLARGVKNSRIMVDFLNGFQWVDLQTRVVFVEFTTYCVNTNAFTIVHLVLEKSATGYFIPNYQIETCKFLFLVAEVEVVYQVMMVLFSLLLLCFLFREGLRIRRITFKNYIKRAFAVLNLVIIFCGLFSTTLIFLRVYYVESLLDELEKADNNIFVSFAYVACWYMWSVYIGAVLIFLESFRLIQLLTFRVVYAQHHKTILRCYKHFVTIIKRILVWIFAFSAFFYLTLIVYDYEFTTLDLSLSSMIAGVVTKDDAINYDVFLRCPWFVTAVYFLCFIMLIVILSVNFFTAVVYFYYQSHHRQTLVNRYSIIKYMKYILTRDEKSDLLRLSTEYDDRSPKSKDPPILRLKGGGNSNSTDENKKTTKKQKTKIKQKTVKRNVKKNNRVVLKKRSTKVQKKTKWKIDEENKNTDSDSAISSTVQDSVIENYRMHFGKEYKKEKKDMGKDEDEIAATELVEKKGIEKSVTKKHGKDIKKESVHSRAEKEDRKKEQDIERHEDEIAALESVKMTAVEKDATKKHGKDIKKERAHSDVEKDDHKKRRDIEKHKIAATESVSMEGIEKDVTKKHGKDIKQKSVHSHAGKEHRKEEDESEKDEDEIAATGSVKKKGIEKDVTKKHGTDIKKKSVHSHAQKEDRKDKEDSEKDEDKIAAAESVMMKGIEKDSKRKHGKDINKKSVHSHTEKEDRKEEEDSEKEEDKIAAAESVKKKGIEKDVTTRHGKGVKKKSGHSHAEKENRKEEDESENDEDEIAATGSVKKKGIEKDVTKRHGKDIKKKSVHSHAEKEHQKDKEDSENDENKIAAAESVMMKGIEKDVKRKHKKDVQKKRVRLYTENEDQKDKGDSEKDKVAATESVMKKGIEKDVTKRHGKDFTKKMAHSQLEDENEKEKQTIKLEGEKIAATELNPTKRVKWNVIINLGMPLKKKSAKPKIEMEEDSMETEEEKKGSAQKKGILFKLKRWGKKTVGMSRRENDVEETEQAPMNEEEKLPITDFIAKKSIDDTKYQYLAWDHLAAMKALTISILTKDQDRKSVEREMALKTLFISLTSRLETFVMKNEIEGSYIIVSRRGQQDSVMEKSKLRQMEKIVEEFGRKRNWIMEDEPDEFDFCSVEENVRKLDEKLTLLLEKSNKGTNASKGPCS